MDVKAIVFNAAMNGNLLQLKASLNEKPREEISLLISARNNGSTPLVIACINGHLDVALYLVESCNDDIDQVASVRVNNGILECAPPLWFAASAGHLNIVEMLVEHSASVNGTMEASNSTPLFAACIRGQFEIAKYLIQHGADIEIASNDGNTCLMVACSWGYYEITKYLLQCGADMNRKDRDGNTALHECAEAGNVDILKMLLKNGAELHCNSDGNTPLLTAALSGNSEVTECFIQEFNCTKQEKVNALELLGSVFMLRYSDAVKAFEFWKRAMELRYEDGGSPLEKPTTRSPVASCLDATEVRSLQQLEDLVSDRDEMTFQALLVLERILCPGHKYTHSYILNIGYRCHKNGNFHKCVSLWMYALDVQLQVQEYINYCTLDVLSNFIELFSRMMLEPFPSEKYFPPVLFQELLHVFGRNLKLIEKYLYIPATQKGENYKIFFHEYLITAIHLVGMMCKLQPHLNRYEIAEFKRATHKLVRLNPKGWNGLTPLHLACCIESSDPDFMFSIIEFPSSEVVDILLEMGACPNAVNDSKNTPLHLAAMNMPCPPAVFKSLVNHGAHLDFYNNKLETPLQFVDIMSFLYDNPMRYINLQCLCAKAIRNHKIDYEGFVPKQLNEFLDSH